MALSLTPNPLEMGDAIRTLENTALKSVDGVQAANGNVVLTYIFGTETAYLAKVATIPVNARIINLWED